MSKESELETKDKEIKKLKVFNDILRHINASYIRENMLAMPKCEECKHFKPLNGRAWGICHRGINSNEVDNQWFCAGWKDKDDNRYR